MNQVIPSYVVAFQLIKNGEIINFNRFNFKTKVATFLPLPGDEVMLPKEVANQSGFSSNIFTVTARQFAYDGPEDVASGVLLTVSQP